MEPHVADTFEQWKDFLSKQVNSAKNMGASEQSIVNTASKIGDWLAANVQPDMRENRLLKELWDKGSPEEQHALASMITKMVSDGKVH